MGVKKLQRKRSRLRKALARLKKVALSAFPKFKRRLVHLKEGIKATIGDLTKKIKEQRKPKPDFNGHPQNVSGAVKEAIVRANKAGLVVTSTTGGTHSSTSWHYSGRAVDVAGPYSQMVAYQNSEARRGASKYNELFGPDSFYIKNGTRIGGAFPDHQDHVHVAPR